MPVSTALTSSFHQGSAGSEAPRAKRCKLCDESSHRSEPGSGYWQLQLDRDLVDTISAIYPEWFKDKMAEGGSSGLGAGGGRPPSPFRESPPKAVIDTSPILMDQNKESLKVKLLMRRPLDQLVAQGIMPPHGQRRSAERAKTGDILKAKIQQRPPRHELERRHILEAEALHADPSLAERQRMLKKARLADQLNDQLSHRPGPLELIQKNILHTEEPIEEAVKTGKISYKATSEGALKRPQHPQNYVNPDEDSQGSSEGDATVSPGPSDVLETAAKSAGIVVSFQPAEGTVVLATATPGQSKDCSDIVFADLCRPLLSQGSVSSPASTSTLSPLSSAASPVPCIASQPPTPIPVPPPPPLPLTRVKCDAPGKEKNRKKSKSKSTPKARTIKFHEYKGPPSALKSCSTGGASGESSYDLLLKQQTLLLQFQLQLQHKYPQIILPASQKAPPIEPANGLPSNAQQPSPAPSTCSETSMPGRVNLPGKLEDMKVSDLKAELKRRNLPVSGCKPQLIERLKSCASQSQPSSDNPASVDSSVTSSMDQSHNSPTCQDLGSPQEQDLMEVGDPVSPAPSQQSQDSLQRTNEDLVREQKRQIEVLQRELTLSQLRLQALNSTRAEPNTQMVLQKHLQAKQQAAQQQQQNIALQMRQLQAEAKQAQVNEEQQRLQQQQHVAFQNQKNLGGLVINGDQKNVGVVLNGAEAAFVYQLMQCKPAKLINGHSRPSFVLADVKREYIEEVKQPPEIKIEYSDVSQSPKPPPLYTDATAKKSSVKSQTVDDVLEILIKNGELPPSAASYPSTPGSAGPKGQEPLYPNLQAVSTDLDNNVQMIDACQRSMTASPVHSTLSGIDPNELLDSLDNVDFNQLMDFGAVCPPICDNNNVQPDQEHNSIVPMDTDEWLEALMPNDGAFSGSNSGSHELGLGYDSLLGIGPDSFDPFNLEEFRSPADLTLSWDKVDYAT
ncbi:myocardin-related transcription factor B isoform X1 [Dendroctonus ponderosae]|uniref:myocardin-related transcription factor B isoform X1 n=3 Tax=Dendroctonus ponderosae TaxID=77166 RepID=UPI002035F218|nr:myocardin-related transcription factor B isoform X1 [Dendroctonus ponderosae]